MDFESLNDYVWFELFKYVDLKSAIRLERANRRAWHIVQSLLKVDCMAIAINFDRAEELDCCDEKSHRIKSVDYISCHEADVEGAIAGIAARTNLTSVSVKLDETCCALVHKITKLLPNLRHLYIDNKTELPKFRVSNNVKNLNCLSIKFSDESVRPISFDRYLDCNLTNLITSNSQLRYLQLSEITESMLRHLLANNQELRTLIFPKAMYYYHTYIDDGDYYAYRVFMNNYHSNLVRGSLPQLTKLNAEFVRTC